MDEERKDRVQAHPEIKWSHVIRERVRGVLDDLEKINELAAESTVSVVDVANLTDMIEPSAAERAERYRIRTDSATEIILDRLE